VSKLIVEPTCLPNQITHGGAVDDGIGRDRGLQRGHAQAM
jgi:hypothetical protein